jgi:lipopolysaccharide export system ATP-binding protein
MTIVADNLQKTYNKRQVVKGVSFNVKRGEIVGLLGPNGAGKTTSFYMVVGLVKPDGGAVLLDDKDVTHIPMHEKARMGIGYLPQEASVFRKLSVHDNIMLVLEHQKLEKTEAKERLEQLIEEFHLHKVVKSYGYQLSGGERRRVEIARALATNPHYILLDEPFSGIDPIAVADIQSLIERLKLKNIGVLITDHNVRETLSVTDRAYIISDGSILMEGNANDIINNPIARQYYLGEKFRI